LPVEHPSALPSRAPERCDLAIVGAGIVGLAVARELIARHPQASVCVLEREQEVATHQTAHNSGVVHAGIYYEPGSLKARLCTSGARELRDYCAAQGIPCPESGKLILATREAELPRLHELERRGRANGVQGLRLLTEQALREIEPHARAIAGLHSPQTSIVNFAAVARALAAEIVGAGATIATGCAVTRAAVAPRALRLTHEHGSTDARHAIFCAGAWADRLAKAAGADVDPRIVPFRGAYLRLRPERRELVRSLIYPVPDPALPFLGVHFSRTVGGEVLVGPTALLALARDAYDARTVRGRDLLETLAWPGTWAMAARHMRAGATELRHAARRRALVTAASRFVPELTPRDVQRGFAGVRAQALSRRGELLSDFAFSLTERALHVRNAPSPAATAAFAIARHIADAAERELGLAR
jgi:(S)-2-hydroxyglutarate dehydrogenase